MNKTTSQIEPMWHYQLNEPQEVSSVDNAFLSRRIVELDNDAVTAIILKGSYARSDATSYSDVDLTRFVKKPPEPTQQKQFVYREGRLISISTRTLAQERMRLSTPEEAIFVVSGIQEARILLDKEGAFSVLQEEARAFTWEPLQEAANTYASTTLMEHTEYVHKILRALHLHDEYALVEITLELLFALTDAVVVQRGLLIISGNTYFRQAQEAMGVDSLWTQYHKRIAGIRIGSLQGVSSEEKGVAALRFYEETVKLLEPVLHASHRDVVEQTVHVIHQALSDK